MQYQIVFGKAIWLPTWQYRHDDQPVEKYDNDLPDGIHYTDGTAQLPASIESEIVESIKSFYDMRVNKSDHETVMALNNRINLLVAKANTAAKILSSGKKIVSQYEGKDVFGNEYVEGTEVVWLRNVGTVVV